MLFTTTTQYIALVVALIAGWLLGLASHPGGKKWKQRYADERNGHVETRRTLEARVAELERDNARLASATPVATTPVDVAPVAPGAASRAEPAYRDDGHRPL